MTIAGEVKEGEERFEGGVAVDERGDMGGAVLNEGAEGQDEEREEEEGEEIGGERRGCFSKQLGSCTQVLQPRMIAHGGSAILLLGRVSPSLSPFFGVSDYKRRRVAIRYAMLL